MEIQQFKKTLDPLIQSFLDSKLKKLSLIGDKTTSEYLNYLKLFLNEGKRIRAYLAYLTYKAQGGKKDNEVLELLVFIELLHAFLLIHDDIMDKAEIRHGIKTAHKFIEEKVGDIKGVDSKNFGISQAILLGDYLFAWAYEIIDKNKKFDKETLEKVKSIVSETIDEVVLGQMLDLNTTLQEKVSKEEIIKKITIKSAYYSFVRPMQIGAVISENKFNQKLFEELGKNLGIAFQTQDDLLDINVDEAKTHKSTFNDVTQRQQTLFTYHVFHKGTDAQKKLLSKYFGTKLKDFEKKELRRIFEDSGAIEEGKRIIAENFTKAKDIVNESELEQIYKHKFIDLIKLLTNRGN